MRHKFKCHACGKCCQHFFPNAEGQPPIAMRDGAMNIYFTPPEAQCVPLLPWEAGKLKAHAKQLGIPVNIRPNIGFPSKRANAVYVVDYVLNHSKCPFLDANNKCGAYKVRPLVCQGFPIVDTGMILPPLVFRKGDCPQFVNPFKQESVWDDADKVMAQFVRTYPEAYIARLRYEILLDYLTQLAKSLHGTQFLQFSPCTEREVQQFECIDLLSFLSRQDRVETSAGELLLTRKREGWGYITAVFDMDPFKYLRSILEMPPTDLIQLGMTIHLEQKVEAYRMEKKYSICYTNLTDADIKLFYHSDDVKEMGDIE
jgi:Fe-S-cluster containining protein